jgi:hypothetical protein
MSLLPPFRSVCWLALLALLLLTACNPGPAIVENPPASIDGAWINTQEGHGAFLLFLADTGEFRTASRPDLLFDVPLLIGRYAYDAGRLTLSESLDSGPCHDAGTYLITAYGPGDEATMTLHRERDDCGARVRMFHNTAWVQAAPDG